MIATPDLMLAFRALRLPLSMIVLGFSLFGSLALIAALAVGINFFVQWLGLMESPWLQGALAYGGSIFVIVMGWFIFPVIMTAIASLFLEPIADQLERQHYPDLPAPKPAGLMTQIKVAVKGLSRALALNIIILPFLFIPLVNVGVYLLVNAGLLAREYFYIISLRHMSLSEADALYTQNRALLMKAGVVAAILFIIPVVNLLAPVVITAFMLHVLVRKSDAPLRVKLALAPQNVLPG